mgnify:FL=1
MSYEKVATLDRMREAIINTTDYLRSKNLEGSKTRSRYLSLAITDLESAENWITRALKEAEGEPDEE